MLRKRHNITLSELYVERIKKCYEVKQEFFYKPIRMYSTIKFHSDGK